MEFLEFIVCQYNTRVANKVHWRQLTTILWIVVGDCGLSQFGESCS